MSKPDGDFAFPSIAYPEAGYEARRGMTLRDYFAAAAMCGILQSRDRPMHLEGHAQEDARLAFRWADAMLLERAK